MDKNGKDLVLSYLLENGPSAVSELKRVFEQAHSNGTLDEDIKILDVLGALDEDCLVITQDSVCSLVE